MSTSYDSASASTATAGSYSSSSPPPARRKKGKGVSHVSVKTKAGVIRNGKGSSKAAKKKDKKKKDKKGSSASSAASSDPLLDDIYTEAAVGAFVRPVDAANIELVRQVHPLDHVDPEPPEKYNLVVIGAGTAGLVSAIGAAGLGARVALIERDLMGGDCLNVGCVPSKALIKAASVAYTVRHQASEYGVNVAADDVVVDFGAAMARLREIRARIAEADSAAKFIAAGVDVYIGEGRFNSRTSVEVNGKTLNFARACIATGGRAHVPDIVGLDDAGYLTNANVFNLEVLPRRLAVIGGGPIGCELAQAFSRFGAEVTIFQRGPQFLPREDREAAEILEAQFEKEGIRVVLNASIVGVYVNSAGPVSSSQSDDGSGKAIRFSVGGSASTEIVTVDEILVAAGRRPNVQGLGLDVAGVDSDPVRGIVVNDKLRTSNKKIYAAGDVASEYHFTHAADFLARIVIRNAMFKGSSKASKLVIPWATYTSPEIAHTGRYERELEAAGTEYDTYKVEFADNDRAICEGDDVGFVKVLAKKGTGKIIGATIVGEHAGDMIGEVSLAMQHGISLKDIAATIHPYPTRNRSFQAIGDLYNRTRLTSCATCCLNCLMAS